MLIKGVPTIVCISVCLTGVVDLIYLLHKYDLAPTPIGMKNFLMTAFFCMLCSSALCMCSRVSLTDGFDPILLIHDLVHTSNHIRHDCVELHVLRSP